MSDKQLVGWAQSSADPEKVSKTVTGAMMMLSAFGIAAMSYFGIPLTDGQWVEISTQFGLAVGSLVTIFGLIQKVLMLFAKRK